LITGRWWSVVINWPPFARDQRRPRAAQQRVRGIGVTLATLLDEAAERAESPHHTATRKIRERLAGVAV